jgi:hypothetical protein
MSKRERRPPRFRKKREKGKREKERWKDGGV